jgi:7,8-dihydroneopterin aldolase/epimerase/oxygenase
LNGALRFQRCCARPEANFQRARHALFRLERTCRRLFLRNYEVYINIGVHDFEKRGEQRVVINVELFVPLALSTPVEDKLREVVDYDFMRATIAKRVEQGHIHLQETLCDDVAKAMLAHPQVRAVVVSTEKPDVYPDCDAVGVEVFRIKED